MKRPTLSALTALLGLLTLNVAQARPLSVIKETGVLRVAAPGDVPPFSMRQGENLTGFEIELTAALAADLGVKVAYESARIDQLTRLLQDNKVDVAISALGITSTREKKVDFTSPIGCIGASIVSLDPQLNESKDLAGKRIGVIAGSIMTSYAQKLPFQKQVNVYPSNSDVVLAIFSRAVDATLVYSVSEPIVKRLYPKANLHFGPELWSVPIGMMVDSASDTTRLALNESLGRLMQNGTYAALSKKYFGKDVRCK